MKRTKLLALLGAAVLTVGTVGMALAIELKEPHQGITITWDEEGNPSAEDANGDPFEINDDEDCVDLEDGQILIHFVQSPTDEDSGLLDVDFDGAPDVSGLASSGGQGSQVDWDVDVTATDDEVVIVTANSDIDGGELKISHICVGDAGETTTTTTDETTTTTDETTTTTTTTTSFTGGEQELTEPPTDAFGTNGQSNPANSAWLLVVALGALLASLVILSPAKSRR
jgi:hypothetical protein